MNKQAINKFAFLTCMTTIIIGAFLATTAIWLDDKDLVVVWKAFATSCIISSASFLIIVVTKFLPENKDD